MIENTKFGDLKDYLFFTSIMIATVLLFVILSCTVTDNIIATNDNNTTISNDEYSKQIRTIEKKIKSNPDIGASKITFKLTSKVLEPPPSPTDSFNYSGLMPDRITVTYTMTAEEALNFLDKKYKQLQKDKDWYIANNRLEEYNLHIAETVNTTKEVCREIKKESPLFANEIWFEEDYK